MMKRIFVCILALVLVAALIGCKSGSTGGASAKNQPQSNNAAENNIPAQSQKKIASAQEIVNALKNAGYEIGASETASAADLEPGVNAGYYYEIGRRVAVSGASEEGLDFGQFLYYTCSDENAAISTYDQLLAQVDYSFTKSSGQGYSKAEYNAPLGDVAQYGETCIISRQENVIVVLTLDWDQYQDLNQSVGATYDYKAQKVLEEFGF